MKLYKILIILASLGLYSCASIIMSGIQSPESDISNSQRYKNANKLQRDLLYLNDICTNNFPNCDSIFPEPERNRCIDSLLTILSAKGANETTLNIAARYYLAHYNNEHTRISGLVSKSLFPFVPHVSNNRWYLLNIHSDYDSLLIGQEITALNGEPMSVWEQRLSKYVSEENRISRQNSILTFINRADILESLSMVEQSDSICISLEGGADIWVKAVNQKADLRFHSNDDIKPNKITEYQPHNYNIDLYPEQNFAYFQYNRCNDKIDAFQTMPTYLKKWVVPMAKRYVERQIKRGDGSKLQGYVDVDRPIFKEYLQTMFDSINRAGIGSLIIDLRHNSGGSETLNRQLVYHLTDTPDIMEFKSIDSDGIVRADSLLETKVKNSESPYYISSDRALFRGRVIVLANHNTSSAAALLAALLQDNSIATVIGTSVANNPTGATTFTPFELPNSKFTGSIASSYIERPNPANGCVLIPDYWIEPSADDIWSGRDSCLNMAIEVINTSM